MKNIFYIYTPQNIIHLPSEIKPILDVIYRFFQFSRLTFKFFVKAYYETTKKILEINNSIY